MKTKAFTLIELIMVVVVLGIMSVIGADIISSMYENYIRTRAVNNLSNKTELALELISKRLQHRIRHSEAVIRRTPGVPAATIVSLNQAQSNDRTLIWLASSVESQRIPSPTNARGRSGWSGIIDLSPLATTGATGGSFLFTPGSILWSNNLNETTASSVIRDLTNGRVRLDTRAQFEPALIPKYPFGLDTDITKYYSNTNTDYTTKVIASGNKRFWIWLDNIGNPEGVSARRVYDQYYLSHTAYVLEPVGTNPRDFNLTLRYNILPWEGEDITNQNIGNRALIAEHVSTFRFRQENSTIRIKLCIADLNRSTNFEFSTCKETVVF